MSLINDALKRARLEAARQQAESEPGAFASAPSHVPPRSPTARIVGVLAAVVALVAATVLFWRAGNEITSAPAADVATVAPRDELAPSERIRPAPADALPTAQAAGPATAAAPASESAPAASQPTLRETAPPTASAEPGTRPADDREAPAPQPAARAAAPEPELPTQPQPVARPPVNEKSPPPSQAAPNDAPGPAPAATPTALDGRTFTKTAQLSGGRELHLQGIAWSDTHPVAMVNGRALGIGEGLEGFLVEAIDPDFVTLRGGDVTFRIKLR
jgi:hypothetical protein